MCERLGSSAGPLAAFGAALLFAAFAILSLGPTPASAAKPCWELVLDDWADNASIDRPFSVACLQQALDRAPEDIRAYSDIEDQIRQALRDTVIRRPQSSTGRPSGADRAGTQRGHERRPLDPDPAPGARRLRLRADHRRWSGDRRAQAPPLTRRRRRLRFSPCYSYFPLDVSFGRVCFPSAARPRVGSADARIGTSLRSTCARRVAAALAEPAPAPSLRPSRARTETRTTLLPSSTGRVCRRRAGSGTPRTRTTRTRRSRAAARRTSRASGTSTVESGGVNPGKANIRDAWAAVDQDGADTFVYLGFARDSAVSRRTAARRSSRSSSTTTRASGTTARGRRFRVGGQETSWFPTSLTATVSTWCSSGGSRPRPTWTPGARPAAASTG